MAIARAGGAAASAFYKMADRSINKVLRSIVGYAPWHREALRIESGIRDTRVDMFVMRFFTKICSSHRNSLIWRVVKMSMQGLSAEVIERPDNKWVKITYVHRQSWTQQVPAAGRLDIPISNVMNMTPWILLVVQEGRLVDGNTIWDEVIAPVDFIPSWEHTAGDCL